MSRLIGSLATWCLLATPALAQEVRVHVVNKATGAPLVGALVSLRNPQNQILLRVLSDERGRASLRAPGPGNYLVRTDGIGYAGKVSEPIVLEAAAAIGLEVALELAPLKLDELVVTGSRSVVCDLNQTDGGVVARIWDEAGKALSATTLTRSNRSLEFEMRIIDRQLGPGGRVAGENVLTRRGPSQRPFQAVDPEILHQRGYVHSESDGGATYYGPDADLLLSDRFLDDHCFGLAERPPAGRVGLTFAPIPSRKVPDIRGTLWLDRTSLELDFLEFAYTGVDFSEDVKGVGGRVAFSRLPNGGWIVSKWHIRMPVIAQVKGALTNRTELRGYREAGGEAILAGSTQVFTTGTAIIGRVFDSLAGRPLGGVAASIQDGAFADTSDQDGNFRLEPPATGNYLVTFHHPRFKILGLDSVFAAATVVRGQTDTVEVAIPSAESLAARVCRSATEVTVMGQVRDAGTTNPLVARVAVGFADHTIRARPMPRRGAPARLAMSERGTILEVQTDSAGTFLVCGVPAGAEATLRVMAPGRTPHLVPIHPGGPALVALEVLVP